MVKALYLGRASWSLDLTGKRGELGDGLVELIQLTPTKTKSLSYSSGGEWIHKPFAKEKLRQTQGNGGE